jgi:NADH-quinone oxidoreductase subunit M
MMQHILSTIVFLPLVGAGLTLLIPGSLAGAEKPVHRYIAVMTSFITFALSCVLVANFSHGTPGMQFVENFEWITSLRISYLIGVDGLSVTLIPLTSLLFLLCMFDGERRSRKSGGKGYFTLFLILETAILGTLSAQDLFLFFAFWEATLLPIYFMIGVWGGANREYSAAKFFLYQLAGSGLFLLGMLVIYYVAEPHSFSLMDLAGGKFSAARIDIGDRSLRVENLVFILMLAGLAVRLPVVPFHSWFPHVAAEAPPALAVILAAVFIKTGAYALVRVNYSLFPEASAWMAPLLAAAGAVNIIYGGICALGQKDIRRLAAYSCVSHMGFVLLGLAVFSSTAFNGALLQMVSHGIYAGLLFFLVGILGSRSGHSTITNEDGSAGFGGLVSKAPVLTGFFTVAVFATLGVPGLGAFPSESLVFLGAFPFHRLITLIGLSGVFLTAGYLLWMFRRVFLGPATEGSESVTDVTAREQFILVPLALLCVFAGSYPTPLIDLAQPTVTQVLSSLKGVK